MTNRNCLRYKSVIQNVRYKICIQTYTFYPLIYWLYTKFLVGEKDHFYFKILQFNLFYDSN
jgi:hypothetical protein